jgi:acyl dehydratase
MENADSRPPMPLNTDVLGLEFEPRTVEVTPRMMLAYAAGIGEVGDYTFDDSSVRFTAPRSFCASLEWPVISEARNRSSFGLTPEERLRGVHVEQNSIFHGLIRAGDRLRTSASVVSLRSTSAGALAVYKLTTMDASDGAPIVTTWYATIFRDVELAGAGGEIEAPPRDESAAGPFDHEIGIPIPTEAAHVYTECSGIWNPIHTEKRVAQRAGLSGILLHGTALWAIAGRELVAQFAEGNPACLLRLRARFRKPVAPGSIVWLRWAESRGEVRFAIETKGGEVAVSDGYASFARSRISKGESDVV